MASAGPHLPRHHHGRSPAHGGGAHGTPAGHAPAGARHGDRRRTAPRRTGRRLLPARHLLVQHREGLGAPAPPGPAARLQRHPPAGRRARRHRARESRGRRARRPGQRRPVAGHGRRVPAQGGTRVRAGAARRWTPSGSASSRRRCSRSSWPHKGDWLRPADTPEGCSRPRWSAPRARASRPGPTRRHGRSLRRGARPPRCAGPVRPQPVR